MTKFLETLHVLMKFRYINSLNAIYSARVLGLNMVLYDYNDLYGA